MKFSEILKSISVPECQFIIGVIVIVIFITSIPYLYGVLTTPEDSIFMANYHRASGDYYVYMSMVEETKEGAITHHNLFTSEKHRPVLVRPFWLTVGVIAKIFNIDTRLIIQIFRMTLLAITIPVIYITIATFINKKTSRYLALLLSISSAGVGYLYYKFFNPEIIRDLFYIEFYKTPTDIWLTEANPILLFMSSPHFQASLIFLLLSLTFFWLGFRYNNFRYLAISGILNLALAFFHPYETVYIFLLTAIYALIIFGWRLYRRERKPALQTFYRWLVPNLIAAPGILYQLIVFRAEPTLKSWSEQSQTTSPDIQFYLLGFGILLPLAIIGSVYLIRNLTQKYLWLLIWCWATIPLLYIPIAFNRRFIEGIFIPLGILATIGIVYLFRLIKTKPGRIIYIVAMTAILVIGILPTNIYNIWSFAKMHDQYKSTPFYLPKAEFNSLLWLKQKTEPGDIILSEHISGFNIPAFTARPVYIGHDLQTANFPEKKKNMDWFFDTDNDADAKKQWLQENNISYLYYGPNERNSGTFNPQTKPYLKEVFSNEEVQVFAVCKRD